MSGCNSLTNYKNATPHRITPRHARPHKWSRGHGLVSIKELAQIDPELLRQAMKRVEIDAVAAALDPLVVAVVESEAAHLLLGQAALLPRLLDVSGDPPQQLLIALIWPHLFMVVLATYLHHVL